MLNMGDISSLGHMSGIAGKSVSVGKLPRQSKKEEDDDDDNDEAVKKRVVKPFQSGTFDF